MSPIFCLNSGMSFQLSLLSQNFPFHSNHAHGLRNCINFNFFGGAFGFELFGISNSYKFVIEYACPLTSPICCSVSLFNNVVFVAMKNPFAFARFSIIHN